MENLEQPKNTPEAESEIEKEIASFEIGSTDGLVEWRLRFEDNSVGDWNRTGIDTNESMRLERLRKELEDKFSSQEK